MGINMIPLVWHPTGNQYTTQFGPGNGCGHHPAWQPHCCKETALLTWYLTDEYRISPKLDWLRNCNFGDAHEFAFGEFINYYFFFKASHSRIRVSCILSHQDLRRDSNLATTMWVECGGGPVQNVPMVVNGCQWFNDISGFLQGYPAFPDP